MRGLSSPLMQQQVGWAEIAVFPLVALLLFVVYELTQSH